MTSCLGPDCGAETTNGLALCDLCQQKARLVLAVLPTYFRNLSRWRPGRAGSRPVPASREPSGPSAGKGDRVEQALDAASNELGTWARALVEDRPYLAGVLDEMTADLPDEVQVVTRLSAFFEEHLTSITTLDWCGEFVRTLSQHEVTLRLLTERVAPGWYAGGCRSCGSGTYVVPGITWVTCGGCGATTYARDHLEVVLDEARDWVARPKALAEAVVALVDSEVSAVKLNERIRRWSHLEWLQPIRPLDERGCPTGIKRYRFGDVLDLALGVADAPTRPKRVASM
jgi:hypothetical protein